MSGWRENTDAAGWSEAGDALFLVGRPPLKEFIRYVTSHSTSSPDVGILTDEWRVAHERVCALEKAEAGAADAPPVRPLGPEYEPLLLELFKDPLVRHGFNALPTDIALVELDRLVVYQKHIDLTFVRHLEDTLGPAPGDERIFRTCLPCDHPPPPVKWSRVHRDTFVFVSPSNDLRFLDAMSLDPRQITGYPPRGATTGVVGLAVGFGSNFLNAVHAEDRLILNNGSHRAYALRELGITHAPCIIQYASTREELQLVASRAVREDADAYLKHPRPAMLKDYFDPSLRKVLPVRRRLTQVTVKFQVDQASVPGL